MLGAPQLFPTATILLSFLSALISSHTVITYPGWRGDNLHTNGSITGLNGTVFPPDVIGNSGLGVGDNNTYPYGMQWIYPCGGMPMSTNRTKWPVGGGAIGLQPGWFSGHASALMYINLGHDTVPANYSLPMQSVFAIVGPQNTLYNGSICIPQVPLPANYTAVVGANATIQIIEAAQHGAALYSVSHRNQTKNQADTHKLGVQCVDITFAEPEHVEKVTPENCANTTNISFQDVYFTNLSSAAEPLLLPSRTSLMASIPLAAAVMAAVII